MAKVSTYPPITAGALLPADQFLVVDSTNAPTLATKTITYSELQTAFGSAGVLPISRGGTGQQAAQAAFDALAPLQGGQAGKFLSSNGTTSYWAPLPPSDADTRLITQTNHLLAVGDVVRLSGSLYMKAQADSATDAEVVGIVAVVPDTGHFILMTDGYVTGLVGLVAGAVYFLSATTPGLLTLGEPTTAGQVSKPLLVADSPTSGYFFNWRGMLIGAPGSGGGGGTPAGASGQLQYNSSGMFAGMAGSTVATAGSRLQLVAQSAGEIPILAQGAPSQAAPLTRWVDSAATTRAEVQADGTIYTATAFLGNGALLTALNASSIATGTVATARLGSGTPSNVTFLRGDGTWASLPAGVAPGGPFQAVQYNAGGGVFAGSANLQFNGNQLSVVTGAPGTRPLVAQGAAAQTAELTAWLSSTAALLAAIKADGAFYTTASAMTYAGVVYTWPLAQGAAGTYLGNNGSGALSWTSPLAGQVKISSQYGDIVTVADPGTGTVNFDGSLANKLALTLTGNRALTLSNDAVGQSFLLLLTQDSTGSRLVTTWPATVRWQGGTAPTLSTAAAQTDVISLLKIGPGSYLGMSATGF